MQEACPAIQEFRNKFLNSIMKGTTEDEMVGWTEACALEPMLSNKRSHPSEKPMHHTKEELPLTEGKSPCSSEQPVQLEIK